MRFYDISRPLEAGVWTWPGDRPFEASRLWKQEDGASVNVGHVALSCHTGTHIDAPYHYKRDGRTAEAIDLAACIGPCVVTPLARLDEVPASTARVLVKAAGGAPRAAQLERFTNLVLFGTDFHSVDPLDSKGLEAHHALERRGAVILEELVLDGVPDGAYDLVALPLRLVGMDAAPARAVLIAPPVLSGSHR